MDTSVGAAAVTVRVAVPLTDPDRAVMVEFPWERAVANPEELIDAMLVVEEVQVAEEVISFLDPSV